MDLLLLLIIGLVSGTLGSLVGLGGGIILVPALLFFASYTSIIANISPQIAVGTSLLVIIFTGLSSTLTYVKHKTVDYKSGLIFLIGSAPGGIMGALVNRYLDLQTFSIYFGLFMIFTSFILMLNGKLKPIAKKRKSGIVKEYINEEGNQSTYGFHPLIGIFISFLVGFSSGLFGIGGGSLMVPAMILLFRFPTHIAVATSMFMIFLSAIVSSFTHIQLGNIEWSYVLPLIPGAWFGGKLGAFLNQKLKGKTLIVLLRLILVIIGIRLIYQGI